MTARLEDFQKNRPTLLGLAYRMLGSMWDAEDVVQDAFVRWNSGDRSEVLDPRAFLMTTVTRLCIDRRMSARAQRETYTGPWLPEPVATDALGPLETAELRDTVSYATLHMMERLSPPERAIFVLREAFQFGYDDIAPVVGMSAASCRQSHRRAVQKLNAGSDRFEPDRSDHAGFLAAFVEAARTGNLSALTGMLSDDVVAWNDGGGRVRAALKPILGREHVVAFVAGLIRRYPIDSVRLISANGQTGVHIAVGGGEQYVAIDVRDGRITALYAVLNPDKLTRLGDGDYRNPTRSDRPSA